MQLTVQRKEKAATGRSLMEQARYGLSRPESGAFAVPVESKHARPYVLCLT